MQSQFVSLSHWCTHVCDWRCLQVTWWLIVEPVSVTAVLIVMLILTTNVSPVTDLVQKVSFQDSSNSCIIVFHATMFLLYWDLCCSEYEYFVNIMLCCVYQKWIILWMCCVIQPAWELDQRISSVLTILRVSLAALLFREKFVFCPLHSLGRCYYCILYNWHNIMLVSL